jgi:acyl carrier protein
MTAPVRADVAVTDVRPVIQDIMRAVLERDVDPAVDVFDQGATSLALIRIVAEIGERYGIAVDIGELEEASIDQLSELVAGQLNSQEPATMRD